MSAEMSGVVRTHDDLFILCAGISQYIYFSGFCVVAPSSRSWLCRMYTSVPNAANSTDFYGLYHRCMQTVLPAFLFSYCALNK